MGNRQPH